MSALSERPANAGAKDFAPSWRPEPGESVSGIVTAKRTAKTKFGTKPTMEVHDLELGPVTVWCGAMLRETYDMVSVGDEVAIVYEGKRISESSGHEYGLYTAVQM